MSLGISNRLIIVRLNETDKTILKCTIKKNNHKIISFRSQKRVFPAKFLLCTVYCGTKKHFFTAAIIHILDKSRMYNGSKR